MDVTSRVIEDGSCGNSGLSLHLHYTQHTRIGEMASASLSIPIALWTSGISTAAVSATLTREHFVVAGLEDGLIWVFTGRGGLTEECSPTQPYSGAISVLRDIPFTL